METEASVTVRDAGPLAQLDIDRAIAATEAPRSLLAWKLSDFPSSLRVAMPDLPHSVLIQGQPGTRKSSLAVALMRHWMPYTAYRVGRGFNVGAAWINVPTWLKRRGDWYADCARTRPASWEDLCEKTLRLLVLDDVGADRANDMALQDLYVVLNQRECDGLATVVTTNSSEAALASWSQRIWSRLGAFMPVVMTGPDRRRWKGA